MDNEQKERGIRELSEILKLEFSDEELREIKGFLNRIAGLLVEAYLDGDLSE